MDYFVTVFFLGLIPAVIARSRGRNFFVWWFYGFWLLPIAFIHSLVVVFLPATASSEGMKQCPFCAEPIKKQAKVCRYCRRDLLETKPFMAWMPPPPPIQAGPTPAPVAPADEEPVDWCWYRRTPTPPAPDPVVAPRPILRDVSAHTSRCDGCGAYIPKARADQHRCAALAKAK